MGKHRTPRIPPEERPYKVGYGKPDPSAGFKPGQIANPKGRPGKTPLNEQLDDVLNRKVAIPEGNRTIKITIFEAIVRAQINLALKGNTKAAAFLFRLKSQLPTQIPGNETDALDIEDRRILELFAEQVQAKATKS